jgi:hypothetical protein
VAEQGGERQPAAEVTSQDVDRVVRRDFPADRVDEVLAALGEYGAEEWHREADRVRVAVLKLAAGSVEQLRFHLESAKMDYRDVLGPAEYPGYSRRLFRIDKLPADERQRIIDADWKQFQEWFERR